MVRQRAPRAIAPLCAPTTKSRREKAITVAVSVFLRLDYRTIYFYIQETTQMRMPPNRRRLRTGDIAPQKRGFALQRSRCMSFRNALRMWDCGRWSVVAACACASL